MSGPRVRPSRSNSMATYRPFSGNNGALGRLIDHLPGPNFISTRFTRPLLSRWSSFRERAYEFRQLLRSESAGPKKRLLIISIPYYDDAWGNLEGAKSDWKIWAMLGEMAGWDVEILTDTDTDIGRFEAPTPENIEKYIRYMLKGNKKADQFVVAYSGHGDAQGLVMADGISHVSPQNLQEWLLEPLNSGALLWTIFDCCESMNLLGLPHRLRQEISGIRYEALTNRSNSTRGTVISIGSSAGSAGEVNLSDAPSSYPPIQSGTLAFIANRFFTPKARAGTGEPLLADYLTLLGKLLQKRPGQEAQVTTSAILSEPVMPSLFAPPS